MGSFFDQALAKGERLAALDIAKALGGDDLANKLSKDAGYLDKMIASADEIAANQLVSTVDIQNAKDLQDRLDAAEKILSERWHPIQDLLVKGGIAMKEAWVSIVESIAKAVDAVVKLVEKLASAPKWFQDGLNAFGSWVTGATTTEESRAAAEKQYGINSDKGAMSDLAAKQDQEAARQNEELMKAARQRLAEGMNKKFDTSHSTSDHIAPDTSAYDRAVDSVNKYILTTNAAADSVGKGAAEQEKAKVVAQLMAAAERDGTTVTADLAASMDKLANRAAVAAQALAKAQIAAEIKFDRSTAFLSADDVAIATKLKTIYPDVATALGSVEAAGIRTNTAMKGLSSAIETNLTSGLTDIAMGTKTASQGFKDMSLAVIRALEEMMIKALIVKPIMDSLQSSIGGGGLLSLLGIGGATGAAATSTGVASVGALGGLYHTGGIVGSEPTSMRYIHPSHFDDAPRFHTGGIAGDEIPIIAKKGEGVFTPGQMAAMGGGSQNTNFTYAPNIDARGADAQAVARLAAVIAQDRKNFERNVQAVFVKGRASNSGAFK